MGRGDDRYMSRRGSEHTHTHTETGMTYMLFELFVSMFSWYKHFSKFLKFYFEIFSVCSVLAIPQQSCLESLVSGILAAKSSLWPSALAVVSHLG